MRHRSPRGGDSEASMLVEVAKALMLVAKWSEFAYNESMR